MFNLLTAVIVARKGSTRVPGKMHAMIDGETMLMRKIRQLRAVNCNVIVGTDDDSVEESVTDAGALFYRREDRLCDERSASVNEMVKDMATAVQNLLGSQVILWAHSTNPFTDSEHYSEAIALYNNAVMGAEYDSVMSANVQRGHFWNYAEPINFKTPAPGVTHFPAACLPPVYAQNGAIFIRPAAAMAGDGNLVGRNPLKYYMHNIPGWDVNDPWELEFAQWYAEKHNI